MILKPLFSLSVISFKKQLYDSCYSISNVIYVWYALLFYLVLTKQFSSFFCVYTQTDPMDYLLKSVMF